ncbi:MAG: hypothetical protein DME83_11300 [Verrucomicrobia bacterium]|nr:MAG: hypothetical protein DME83_11300 [Verrucomicrobiota bacterium]
MNYNVNVILSSWRQRQKKKNIKVRDLTPVKEAKGGGSRTLTFQMLWTKSKNSAGNVIDTHEHAGDFREP